MYSIVFCECLFIFPPETKGVEELLTGLEKPSGYPVISAEEMHGYYRLNESFKVEMCEDDPRMGYIIAFDNSERNNLHLSSILVSYVYEMYEKIEKMEPMRIIFNFQYSYKGQFNLELDPYMLRQIALMGAEMKVLATELKTA